MVAAIRQRRTGDAGGKAEPKRAGDFGAAHGLQAAGKAGDQVIRLHRLSPNSSPKLFKARCTVTFTAASDMPGSGGGVGDGMAFQLDLAHQVALGGGQLGQQLLDIAGRAMAACVSSSVNRSRRFVQRHGGAALLAAIFVDQLVARDAIDPGSERPGGIVGGARL